ncbi:MAG: SGNH/GDSL hydrolase family protein [Algicola sp.]|nr:SGNH/GDSL hydrolase family protein [Algicola sp.]
MARYGNSRIEDRRRLKRLAYTRNTRVFRKMLTYFDKRPVIIAEGDSWFAYPPKNFIGKAPANIMDHIKKRTRKKANMLRLEVSGDEAVDMLQGGQKRKMVNLMKEFGGRVDVLLFSGGGNDIVGKGDMEDLLNTYQAGFTVEQCIHQQNLEKKVAEIKNAYMTLLDIRNQYSPDTVIITHCYDYPFPSDTAGRFLLGLIRTGPWMKPFMDAKKIKDKDLQRGISIYLIDAMYKVLQDIEVDAAANGKFKVVKTIGTLPNESDWQNEIHPTRRGFGLVAEKIYNEMLNHISGLPRW